MLLVKYSDTYLSNTFEGFHSYAFEGFHCYESEESFQKALQAFKDEYSNEDGSIDIVVQYDNDVCIRYKDFDDFLSHFYVEEISKNDYETIFFYLGKRYGFFPIPIVWM